MKLYDTFSRSVVPLECQGADPVTLYVCGPTVYDDPHIGHARSAYIFDVLKRFLRSTGRPVRLVRNVTDVDDKIIARARQECGAQTKDLTPMCQEVARRYLARYHAAMDHFGLQRPDVEPLATDHVVPEMTDLIAKLLIQGVAYEAQGDVYFAVRKFPTYGALSHRTVDELQAGARIEPGEAKHDPLDFALWKTSKPGEPSWESPWGPGRPGWHLECSAMSTKYLGDTFDLHGGGIDLVFPHHENERAQSQAAGMAFARLWMHHGLLTVQGEKMSKSLGNYFTLEQVLETFPHPDYLKLLFLKTHYRSPMDYAPAKMEEAKKNWQEFARFFHHAAQQQVETAVGKAEAWEGEQAKAQFDAAMDDDLNTPQALAALFELVNLGHRLLASGDERSRWLARRVLETLRECGMTLGLFLQGTQEEPASTLQRIRAQVAERDEARRRKAFVRADAIRQALLGEGVRLTDTANGTFWHRGA